MDKSVTMDPAITLGVDVSDKSSEVYVVDRDGSWLASMRLRTTREALVEGLARYRGARVVMEVGTHSPWMSRLLDQEGFEVVVANPRRVRLIAESDSKNDRFDAEQLARLGRIDPGLLSPIVHRGEDAQRDRVLLQARDGLVRARTQMINQARGFAKSLGSPLPRCSAEAFPTRVRSTVSAELFCGLETLLETTEQLTAHIQRMEHQLQRVCRERYPETGALRQIAGIGPITALAFVLTLEDPQRFATSRAVGAYLGLRPRQRDSGTRRQQLSITKAGDAMLRRLLVGAAQYILGPFGPDTDLRRFGLRLAERGGSSAKKRAAVAVARKLAILMHRLWITGEAYEAVGYGRPKEVAA